jgi:hypothetical protein
MLMDEIMLKCVAISLLLHLRFLHWGEGLNDERNHIKMYIFHYIILVVVLILSQGVPVLFSEALLWETIVVANSHSPFTIEECSMCFYDTY